MKTAADRDPNIPLAHNNGVPVYMFRIQSHFDIRRAYNSQTGEESNVIEENANDRRWQDREYVRVDFSQNLNTASYDFDTMALLGVYNGVQYTSQPFDIQDPNDKNAPVIDTESGYFDVTNRVFAQPQMLEIWGMRFPGCMLLGFFLASSRADADLIPGHRRPNLEAAVMGRAGLTRYLVKHGLPLAGEPLLELRLEVEALEGSLLDLLIEGGDDRRRRPLETVLEVAGADQRLAHRRERPLGGEQGLNR